MAAKGRNQTPMSLQKTARKATRMSDEARAFDMRVQRLRKRLARVRAVSPKGRIDSISSRAIRRSAYKIICEVLASGGEAIFDEIIKDYGCRKGRTDLADQPLKKGLRALFPGKELDRRQRLEWGNEFEYAHSQCVEADALISFIKLTGSRLVIQEKLEAYQDRFIIIE